MACGITLRNHPQLSLGRISRRALHHDAVFVFERHVAMRHRQAVAPFGDWSVIYFVYTR